MLHSHIDIGGQGPLLHFSPANGYPPRVYRALLEAFVDSHRVIATLHRPLWQPAVSPDSLSGWQQFGDDLLEGVLAQGQAVLSLGHSMGASAVVMAATRQPDLFRGVVMIEPVLVPPVYTYLLKLFRGAARRRVPMIRRTLARTDRWASKAEAFEHFRPKSVFKDVSDAVLWDYVEHGTSLEADGSCRLSYSKEWEVQCYLHVFNLWQLLPRLTAPVLAIRGEHSDTVSDWAWRRWQLQARGTRFVEVADAGHLLPLEQPETVAAAIHRWLPT